MLAHCLNQCASKQTEDEHLQLWGDCKLKTSYWFFNQTKLHWIESGAVAAGWHWGVKSGAKKVLMKWLITLHYCIFYFWLSLSLSCLSLSLIADQTENALSSSSHSGTLVLLRAAARLDKLHIPSFCLLFTVSLDTWLGCARIFSETFSSSFFPRLRAPAELWWNRFITRCPLLTCWCVTLLYYRRCVCFTPLPLPVQTTVAEAATKPPVLWKNSNELLQNEGMNASLLIVHAAHFWSKVFL